MQSDFCAGRIDLIIGPTYALKTFQVLRRLWCAQQQQLRCVYICFSPDPRDEEDMTITSITCHALLPIWRECMKYDTIGIDQAQLFPDVPQFAQLLANSGKIVIVAGVDGNYERKPFGTFLNIMPCCETLRKLSSICPETGLDAAFTRLLADDTHTPASRTSYFGIPTKGFIHLIIGPSKAGKESELFRMLMRYAIALRKCILVRPITKTGLPNPQPLPESGGMTKMIPVIESDALPPGESLLEYDAIGISKGHRYVGLGEWADGCANAGKVVIIAAADGDQNQEPYRGIVELLPRCEQVHKLDAMCFKTGQPAPFWVFEGNRKIAVSRQALLGGAGNLAGNLSE